MFCSANPGHAPSAKKPRCTTLSRLTKRGGGDGGKEVAQFILLLSVKARKRTSLLMFKAVAELVTGSRADDDDGQSLFAQ